MWSRLVRSSLTIVVCVLALELLLQLDNTLKFALGPTGVTESVPVRENVPLPVKEDGSSLSPEDLVERKLPSDDPQLVALLRKQFLAPPSVMPYNLSGRNEFGPVYVRNIHNLFSSEKHGFFVEAGALDGEHYSNSLWLERENGWRGLLVEPSPVSYELAVKKHRNAWLSGTCLSRQNHTTKITLVLTAKQNRSNKPREHYFGRTYEEGLNRTTVRSLKPLVAGRVPVYCFPLRSYLLALGVSKIDFLSLDTQGSEFEILKTIPWNEIIIRVAVIETQNHDYAVKVKNFMLGKEYVVLAEGTDLWVAKKGDPVISRWGGK